MKKQKNKLPKWRRKYRSLLLDNKTGQNLLLSFLVPFGIFAVLMAVRGLIPFDSDYMILAHDEWHQYYPFLLEFRRKLLSGGSMAYSWASGMGTNYTPLYAYYLSSPLYLLSVLIPEAYMTDFLAVLTYIKIGFAGLFFACFIRTTFRKCDASSVAFGTAYALCAFACGYYWNVIWLDTFALLPLVAAGTVKLLRDMKFGLYIVSLFLAIWCSYYISFFVCIFTALFAASYMIICWKGFKNFFGRLGLITLCTAVAIGMTAVLVIPTYLSIGNTHSAANRFPEGFRINIAPYDQQNWAGVLYAFRQTLSGLLTETTPTSMTGNPNVFCGMAGTFLSLIYLFDGKIKLRERLAALLLLLFFCASFIFRQLDYIWHGFHFPNMLPYRFSFLFSFVMLVMAWRAFQHLERYKLWQIIAAGVLTLAILASSFALENVGKRELAFSLAACLAVGMMYFLCRTRFGKEFAATLLIVTVLVESGLCLNYGEQSNGLTSKTSYPEKQTEVSSLLTRIEQEELGKTDLYRTEVAGYQSLNDSVLNGYNGVSIFSSTTNVAVSNFTKNLGLASWPGSNRYAYIESTPFTNLMINLKYIINRDGYALDPENNPTIASAGNVQLQKNRSYLPMGFLTNPELAYYQTDENKLPMDAQQELFTDATGIGASLYTPLESKPDYLAPEGCTLTSSYRGNAQTAYYNFSTSGAKSDSEFSFTYHFDEPVLFCFYLRAVSTNGLTVYNGERLIQDAPSKVGTLYCLGEYREGESVEIKVKAEPGKQGIIVLQAAAFNQEVFDAGVEYLAQSTMKAEKVTDTSITGSIQANRKGLFYTSIPYEPGWTAYVDGVETKITPVGDAFVAFPLDEGLHKIRIEYQTPGRALGLKITIASFATFVLMIAFAVWHDRHRKRAKWVKPRIQVNREYLKRPEQPDGDTTPEKPPAQNE
ncbi:MAG: YfhO family protein [Clostridia bacterium]|nr:YfhO family protein [Clostridia bacterium]